MHTLRQFVCYSLCVFFRCNGHATFTVVTPRSQLHPVPHLRASIESEKNVGAMDLGKSLGGQEELRRWRFGTLVLRLVILKKTHNILQGETTQSLGSFFLPIQFKGKVGDLQQKCLEIHENEICYILECHLFIIYPTKDLVWQGVKGLETWRPSKGCQRGGSWGAIDSATLLESQDFLTPLIWRVLEYTP